MPYDPRIISGIMSTASSIGMDPLDLATIMSYETGGTFNPTQGGPTTKYGQHRGFIQFGEPQARQYGVDWSNPIESQLGPDGAVARYFRENGYKPGMGIMDAYSTVNAGAPGRYGASDAAAGGAPGTVADKVTKQFGPHAAKAAALLGMDPSALANMDFGGGGGGVTMSSRNMDSAMIPMTPQLPNGPVPQYTPRQGMISQLMGGNFRGAMTGMFSPDPNANPTLEAERFGGIAEMMQGLNQNVNASMQNTNAPVSWAQVLGSVLTGAAGGAYEGLQEGSQANANTQMGEAMGQQMTPERIAQISALNPEVGAQMGLNVQNQQNQNLLLDKKIAADMDQATLAAAAKLNQDPTALMQNLVAAGYTPGTPEYQAAMQQLLVSETTKSGMGVTGYDSEGRPIIGMTSTGAAPLPPPGGAVPAAPGGAPAVAGAPSMPVEPGTPGMPIEGPLTNPGVGAPIGGPGPVGTPGTGGNSVSGVPITGPIEIDKTNGTIMAPGPQGSMEVTKVPGGKAADEAAAAAEKAANAAKQKTESNRVVLDSIDEAIRRSQIPGAFGAGRVVSETIGGYLPGGGDGPLSGSPAASLNAILEPIKANVGFDRLQQMRDASPTGGALGPVSDTENTLLQSTMASLSTAQTKEEFQQQLNLLRSRIIAVTTGENYEAVMGFPPPSQVKAGSESTGIPAYEKGKVYVDKNGTRAIWNGTSWEEQ